MRVIVTGGTGFIGPAVCTRLLAKNYEVVVFTRDASRSREALHPRVEVVSWTNGAPAWEKLLDGALGIVNLAGESIAQRWTKGAKERIASSRVEAARRLHDAVSRISGTRPSVLVNASAIGIYGPHADEELDEANPAGHDFLATTTVAWEEAAERLSGLGLRVAKVRTGLVLGAEGGALAKMLPPFRLGLGGPLGSGTQWMSWIHRDDLADLLVFALENPNVRGVVNGTAPNPRTMREFAKALGRALRRPVLAPPVPAFVLKALLGEMSTLLLDGQRVLPRRAQELGFRFRFPELDGALADLVG